MLCVFAVIAVVVTVVGVGVLRCCYRYCCYCNCCSYCRVVAVVAGGGDGITVVAGNCCFAAAFVLM